MPTEEVEVVNEMPAVQDVTLKEKFVHLIKQFFSFLLVSGVGWLMDFAIFFLLTKFLGLIVIVANIISSIPAITYVFLMSNKKIFKNNNSKLSLKAKYVIYFVYQIILLLCVSALGQLLYNVFEPLITIEFILNNLKMFVKILITPITMVLNFVIMKYLIEKLWGFYGRKNISLYTWI